MLYALLMGSLLSSACGAGGQPDPAILLARDASRLEVFAAREIARYLYLSTDRFIQPAPAGRRLPAGSTCILVARRGRRLLRAAGLGPDLLRRIDALERGEYLLKTVSAGAGRVLLVVGGDGTGVLYAAYRLAEHFGVRFYLHGDAIPDAKALLALPVLDEQSAPLFRLRGIQPFHDFPEGPDWWDLDDYKAILSQLPKLRMNFFGLHTYPEGHPCAEPTVWIGLKEEIGRGAEVRAAYPSSYHNTLRGNWGYAARKTGSYSFGAATLFDRDAYGGEVMRGVCPRPGSPEASRALFERTGAMLRRAFRHARELGIRTCVGTETPLTIPARVRGRLQAAGRGLEDPAVIRELYEGIFTRVAQVYQPDFYWFWTPEGWTWQGASSDAVKKTMKDLGLAIEAWENVKPPFRLATCGWVLGPQGDRAYFDKALPQGVAVSCINRQVGKEPVDPAFERVTRRGKWAIPWLEDDPGLTAPQLWVGRMRRDARDALRYGCTGLMGIHWRTRVLGPNVAALARAAWTQAPWSKTAEENAAPVKVEGPEGGNKAAFPGNPIAGTDDDPLYQTVRYDVAAYRLAVPDGKYKVTLKFCEPHYGEAGKRVFGVKLEGKQVIEKLDILAAVGKNKALDRVFDGVEVRDAWLDIEFVKRVEYPSIAAFAVEGKGFSQKVNCGGPAYRDYGADWDVKPPAPRYPPADDFYQDWALTQFGPGAGPGAAAIFTRVDGKLPRPADWVGGPGGIRPDPRPWKSVEKDYAFVEELAALRAKVNGAGNLERFDYWVNTFRYMKATGRVRCLWAGMQKALGALKKEGDPAARRKLAEETALPLRVRLVEAVRDVYAHLLATVGNPGELGTIMNWEQHILPSLLEKPGRDLAAALGRGLPPEALPRKEYDGSNRIIVPSARTSIDQGEVLELKVILLSRKPPAGASVLWRPLGGDAFREVPLRHVARGVYRVRFPEGGAAGTGYEYHVKVKWDDGTAGLFPATAPAISRTLVVMPAAARWF